MTFKAIVDADTLSDAIEPVSALVDECKVNLLEDGIEIRAVDAANVGMVDVSLDAGAFESYDADGGLIGIDLDRFEDVLSMAESGDLVHLFLNEETRKLEIAIDGLEYTLACIDPESVRREPEIPDLDLPATFILEGKALGRAITAADLVGDHIAVIATADSELVFEAEGDTDSVDVTLTKSDLIGVVQTPAEDAESLFSLDYLQDMERPIAADADVSLLVGDEFPAKLRYSRADGAVKVVNMLAPRISSE